MPQLMSLFSRDDQHEPLLASLSSTIIHSPGGNPLLSSEETQSTLLIRLGDYLNILRTKEIETAMYLERAMVKLDKEGYHMNWREKIIKTYRQFNPNFPENFKIKVRIEPLFPKKFLKLFRNSRLLFQNSKNSKFQKNYVHKKRYFSVKQ